MKKEINIKEVYKKMWGNLEGRKNLWKYIGDYAQKNLLRTYLS